MRQTTTNEAVNPAVGTTVNERSVIGFSESDESRSPLDAVVRAGARKMLQAALESEVQEFLGQHSSRVDDQGRRQVVRNGYLPPREIVTGAGPLEVSQPRVRDKSADATERVRFSSSILPPYLRKSKSIEELIPWLYLKGISTGDFSEALQSLIGPNASGFSANVVVRLKEQWSQEYDTWSRRDLSGKHYVYIWADGIYANVRLEDEANSRQCLLVLMGATAEGEKELIAVIDGYRESKQSWMELLLDLKQRGLTIEPKLAIGDGALGFWAAVREVYTKTREQRCWVHKTANVLNKMPKSVQPKAKADMAGRPRPGKWATRPSITSWKSTERSTPTLANASRRIVKHCSSSTTSRPNTGATYGPPTPSKAPSQRFVSGIEERKETEPGEPVSR